MSAKNRCPGVSVKIDNSSKGRHILVKNEDSYPRSIGRTRVTFSGCQALYDTQCIADAGAVVDVSFRNEDTQGSVGVNIRFVVPATNSLSWNYGSSP